MTGWTGTFPISAAQPCDRASWVAPATNVW